jgi:phosphoenolpyruvate-protein phosphotransferase (PTS system enzyme I)
MDEPLACQESPQPGVTLLSEEVRRFDNACAHAVQELDTTIARVIRQVGEEEAAIFRAHRLLLCDPALIGKVKSTILDQHVDALTALQRTLAEYTALFARIQDDYLKERLADIRDIVHRIQTHLGHPTSQPHLDLHEPVIVVAAEILPSQVMAFAQLPVAGIITETGGATGHAAILARSLSIPAVSSLPGILREVKTGDLVAMDGREGCVHLDPGPEVEAAYRTLQREYATLQEHLIENRDQEPVTTDGVHVELLANVNGAVDAGLAVRVGAGGVGLYRTEYLFLTHPGVPDEEEQLATYQAVVESAPNHAVTIRTLDVGGDKRVAYLGIQQEANPSLGYRSTRLIADHPEFLQTQLRAILRSGLYGSVSLLFPMITTLQEVRRLKQLVDDTRASLHREGVPFGENIPFGVMLEVPAAALCIDDLLDEVDFVSIGSNDLIQYVMAADRNNPKVAHLCEPFSPAIFRLLHQIISACNARGTPVTLCGEMAGRLRCFLPLFGMGLRCFSMSPAFVPPLKDLVRRISQPITRAITDRVLRMKTTEEIREYLTTEIRKIWPEASLLDTND